MIFLDNICVGTVELNNIDKENLSAHVCRFLLCETNRNKGLGVLILKQLSNIAFQNMGLNRLTLNVFCYNVGAIRCYKKAGFIIEDYKQQEDTRWNTYSMELLNS